MDGAMWGPLRACSCLCPWSKGVGLVTGENHHGMQGEGRNKEQRRKQSLEGERPRGRGLGETTLPRLSPSTQKQKDANIGARWGHWPADDTSFLFAGGWAVTQGGSQWERRRWLHQLMLKKTRGSCCTVIPSALSTSLQQLPHSKMLRAFRSTTPLLL